MQPSHSSHISIESGFFIQLAIALMLLPANWVVAWFFAAAVHELCHYLALCLCDVRVYAMRISLSGASIETEPMRLKHELISSLAGPFGGICLISLVHIYPEAAISALMQSVFNLLPIYPFDGWRALTALLCYFFKTETANKIRTIIQISFFTLLLLLSVLAWKFLNLGLLPVGISLLMLIRSFLIKTPCKPTKQIVQ